MTYLTYDKQLRSETDPEVIANLLRKGWVESPQPAYDPATETCQWIDGAWVVAQIVVPVPQRSIGWNRWEYKENIVRDSPIIVMLQNELGWTDAHVDDLYKNAAAIAQSPN